MAARPDTALWMGAFGASIVVHGAMAAMLAFAPGSETPAPATTRIALQSLQSHVPKAVAATPVPRAPASRQAVEAVAQPQPVAPVATGDATTPIPDALADAVEPARTIAPVRADDIATSPSVESERMAGAAVDRVAPLASLEPPSTIARADRAQPPLAAMRVAGLAIEEVLLPPAAIARPAATSSLAPATPIQPAREATAVAGSGVAALIPAVPGEIAPTRHGVRPDRAAPAPRPAALLPVAGSSSDTGTIVRHPLPTTSTAVPMQNSRPPEPEIAMVPVRPEHRHIEARPIVDPLQQVSDVIAEQGLAGGCFLALASPSPHVVDVHGYADTEERLQRLQDGLEAISGISVSTRQHRIASAQCEALSFARSVSPDPIAQLPIISTSAEIASGSRLAGAIHHLRRKWLYLVVVDDEGKVQELDDLARGADGTIGFHAPITLTDGPVDTVQLLLAVASNHALETFERHEGENARGYFAALSAEIDALGSAVEVGVAGFVVR